MKEIKNARITSAEIEIENHGILTCWLYLDYDGAGQGFGGYEITLNAGWWIDRILKTVGVQNWADLEGKNIRAEVEHIKVHRIGHIIEDRWFDPEKENLGKELD